MSRTGDVRVCLVGFFILGPNTGAPCQAPEQRHQNTDCQFCILHTSVPVQLSCRRTYRGGADCHPNYLLFDPIVSLRYKSPHYQGSRPTEIHLI